LGGYGALAAIGLVAALALRRPELAIVAAPFALVLAGGTALARDPGVELELTLATDRTVELAEVEAELIVSAPVRSASSRCGFARPAGVCTRSEPSRPEPAIRFGSWSGRRDSHVCRRSRRTPGSTS